MNLLGEVTYLFSFVCAYVFFAGRGGGGGGGEENKGYSHLALETKTSCVGQSSFHTRAFIV